MTEANDRRTFSKEGFLLADAVLTRSGSFPYLRGELGLQGDPKGIVNISRSREVLEQALPSMIGAPITIDHPSEFVKSGNADAHVVGSVASIPTIDNEGKVKAKVRVYNEEAVQMIKSGTDELSPGFNFVMQDLDDRSGTASVAEMSINHVAIVPKGRAGAAVRIMDSLPPNLFTNDSSNTQEASPMIEPQLKEAISVAVDTAMKAQGDASKDDQATKAAFVSAIGDALKPVLDGFAEMKEARDKDIKEAKDAEAKIAADKEKSELVKQVIDAERARFKVLDAARPFIAEDKLSELEEADAKSIMVAAIGDSLPDAASKSEDYLRGVLDNMVKTAADRAAAPGELPQGVAQNTPVTTPRVNDYLERFKNRNKLGG